MCRDKARMTAATSEVAFKLLLSTGNYMPQGCGKQKNKRCGEKEQS
jgi:hypothetical protein